MTNFNSVRLQVQPLTALVPVPRFHIGQFVQWTDHVGTSRHTFTGVIIELAYRVTRDSMNWRYDMAIIDFKVDGKEVTHDYGGEGKFDMNEELLTTSHPYR